MERDYGNLERNFLLSTFDFQDKKVLEIGCGDGYYTEMFLGLSKQYVAIEPDKQKVELAQKKLFNSGGKLTLLHGYTEYFLDILDVDFDLAIFSLSLHHHDNPEQVIKDVLKLLKPDGIIVIIEPVAAGEYCQFLADFHDESIVLGKTNDILESLSIAKKEKKQIEVHYFFTDKKDIRDFYQKFNVELALIDKKIDNFPERNIVLKDLLNIWIIKKY